MELRDYIEAGIKKLGSAVALAKLVELVPSNLSNAKAGQRGLPVYACIRLARLIEVEPMEVIAASELVTEKKEDRKAVFLPFVQVKRFAHLSIAVCAIAGAVMENSVSAFRAFLL